VERIHVDRDGLGVRDLLNQIRKCRVAPGDVMGDDADAPALAGGLRPPLSVRQPLDRVN
jgi:hypothetical protein